MQFTLDEEELRKANEWRMSHPCIYRDKYLGAIGGDVSYTFTPTSLGDIVELTCACGGKVNVTDFESW